MKLTLEAVAALTGGKILSGDPELTVFGVASLLDASHEEASFLGNEKYFEDFLHTSAGIVLVPPALPAYPENVAFVEVDNPSMAFNALVKYFMASIPQPLSTPRPPSIRTKSMWAPIPASAPIA